MTLLEAMSLSKPCVVTDAGGNPEIVQDGVNGIVTPNDDTDAFAGAILKLIKHEDLRSRMAEASYELFKKRFSSAIMIKNYTTHYN